MALYLFLQRIQPLLQLSNFCLQGLHIILLAQDISIFSLHIVADIFVAAAVIMAGPILPELLLGVKHQNNLSNQLQPVAD